MLPTNTITQHEHIGLDLDETLASTFAGMLRVAHSVGKLLACQSIEDFVIHDIFEDPSFGVTRDEMIEIWHQYNISIKKPEDTMVIKGALQWVKLLMKNGIKCSIITARNGNDPLKRKMTLEWLERYFPEIHSSNIHFVNHYSEQSLPKSAVCKNLGITLLIDDHIDNARDMIAAWFSMILLEKPWNRSITFDHPNLHRVQDWQEIIDNLSSK